MAHASAEAQKLQRAHELLQRFDFDAAVFDFDGTLALSDHVWKRVDERFFERRGMRCPAGFAEELTILGFEEGARYTIDTYGFDETVESICAEWNDMGREEYAHSVILRPGAEQYVRALRSRGVPLALATTNDPEVVAAVQGIERLHNLLSGAVYGREVAHSSKDAPDIYLEAAARLGVAPERCVVFEDMPRAAATAKRLGMTVVGVHSGAAHQNLGELLDIVDGFVYGWEELAAL